MAVLIFISTKSSNKQSSLYAWFSFLCIPNFSTVRPYSLMISLLHHRVPGWWYKPCLSFITALRVTPVIKKVKAGERSVQLSTYPALPTENHAHYCSHFEPQDLDFNVKIRCFIYRIPSLIILETVTSLKYTQRTVTLVSCVTSPTYSLLPYEVMYMR